MSAPRLFGTDGIRGPFGEYPLDRPTVVALGAALGQVLHERRQGADTPPTVVLGGDTRDSTPVLARWLATGLWTSGARVRWAGVIPTGGLARLVRDLGADAAAVLSASHNPWPDNGIKLVDPAGFKWESRAEADLESRLAGALLDATLPADDLPLQLESELLERYLRGLRSALPGLAPLAGVAVTLDTGHGAASAVAGPLFTALGAEVVVMNAAPDGRNINRDCGSTHPAALCRALAAAAADGLPRFGVAFDGDADRAVLVDERGELRDGDALLYLWARDLHRAGGLGDPRIVATSMSNLGLERALAAEGIGVVRCGVGDREVVQTLQAEGLLLGGEQSGHVVHLGLSTTGDGLLTALVMAALVAREGRPLSALLAGFQRFPQVLKNVRVRAKPPLESLPAVAAATAAVERRLGTAGRLVLRYSGTEPLARVMIEGPDAQEIETLAQALAAEITAAIGEGLPPQEASL